MNFDDLIRLNNDKLENAKRDGDERGILLYEKIGSLLSERSTLFFEIDMESALKILAQIIPENQVKETYKSLISPEKFGELRKNFKI